MTKVKKAALQAFGLWLNECRMAVRVELNGIDSSQWLASFPVRVHVHEPHGCAISSPGSGTSPSDAMVDLASKVSGKKVEVDFCAPTLCPDLFAEAE